MAAPDPGRVAVMFVLDTNILLLQMGNRLAIDPPTGEIAISVITEIELLSYPPLSSTETARIRALLQEIAIADLSRDIVNATIELRRKHRLKTPDAIIAATALVHHAELITNDEKLLGIPDVRSRSLPIRPAGDS